MNGTANSESNAGDTRQCACGAACPSKAKFCRNCGQPAPASADPLQQSLQNSRSGRAGAGAAAKPAGPPAVKRTPSEARDALSASAQSVSIQRRLSDSARSDASSPPKCSMCATLYNPATAKFCSNCGHARGGTIAVKRHQSVKEEEMEARCSGTVASTGERCGWTFPPRGTFCVHCGTRRKKRGDAGVTSPETPPLAPVGKTREELMREAALSGEMGYDTINTVQCTSIDLLKAFLVTSETLKNWTKGPLLGRGSFGSVYKGLLSTGSFVAVKQIELSN
eukprot:gene17544-27002_t